MVSRDLRLIAGFVNVVVSSGSAAILNTMLNSSFRLARPTDIASRSGARLESVILTPHFGIFRFRRLCILLLLLLLLALMLLLLLFEQKWLSCAAAAEAETGCAAVAGADCASADLFAPCS